MNFFVIIYLILQEIIPKSNEKFLTGFLVQVVWKYPVPSHVCDARMIDNNSGLQLLNSTGFKGGIIKVHSLSDETTFRLLSFV
jgi:hypothetical protein